MNWPVAETVAAATALGTMLGVGIRYAIKIERSFGDQRVVNAQQIAALTALNEKLNGHEALDVNREDRVDRIEDRVSTLERGLALHSR